MALQPSSLTNPGLDRDTSALMPICFSSDSTCRTWGALKPAYLVRVLPDLGHDSHSGHASIVAVEAAPKDPDLIAGLDPEARQSLCRRQAEGPVVPALLADKRSAIVGTEGRLHDGTEADSANQGEQQGGAEQHPGSGGSLEGLQQESRGAQTDQHQIGHHVAEIE